MSVDSMGILQDQIYGSLAPSGDGRVFNVHCENGANSTSVFIETSKENLFPRDCCSIRFDATYQFKDTHRNPEIDTRGYRYCSFSQALLMGDTHSGITGKGVGSNNIAQCVMQSRRCRRFGPNCHQIGRNLCGFLNTNHELACVCPKSAPIGATPKQKWIIAEVEKFIRAGGLEVEPVGPKSSFLLSAFASDHLAAGLGGIPGKELATLALTATQTTLEAATPLSSVFTSVLISIGLDFVFGEEPSPFDAIQALAKEIDCALDTFASEINLRIGGSIDSALAVEDADDLNDATKTQRRNFLNFYARSKQEKFPDFHIGEISEFELLDGRGDALVLANNLTDDISNIVGFSNRPNIEDAKRTAATFDLLKLGWVEVLNMAREAVVMRAYDDKFADGGNDVTSICNGAVFDFSTGLAEMADTASLMVSAAVELLVTFLVGDRGDEDRFKHKNCVCAKYLAKFIVSARGPMPASLKITTLLVSRRWRFQMRRACGRQNSQTYLPWVHTST